MIKKNEKEDRKGVFEFPGSLLVILGLTVTVFVIVNLVQGYGSVSIKTGDYQSSVNKYLLNPEIVLDSPCTTIERGVFNYSKIKGEKCGFSCLDVTLPINLTLKSDNLKLKESCILGGRQNWSDWEYTSTIPIIIVKKGKPYKAEAVIRS